MNVLIVESRPELGELWQNHLVRMGMSVEQVPDQTSAIEYLESHAPEIILLDLILQEGSALAVADFASYRHPNARVIFVTDTSFFSDGSIFAHSANACAFVPAGTRPEDIAAMVEHYAGA